MTIAAHCSESAGSTELLLVMCLPNLLCSKLCCTDPLSSSFLFKLPRCDTHQIVIFEIGFLYAIFVRAVVPQPLALLTSVAVGCVGTFAQQFGCAANFASPVRERRIVSQVAAEQRQQLRISNRFENPKPLVRAKGPTVGAAALFFRRYAPVQRSSERCIFLAR